MEFIFIIAFIVCFIIIFKLNNKVNEQNYKIEQLNKQIGDLNRKAIYNYKQIQRLSNTVSPSAQKNNTQAENNTKLPTAKQTESVAVVVTTEQNEVRNDIIAAAESVDAQPENIATSTVTTTESDTANVTADIPNVAASVANTTESNTASISADIAKNEVNAVNTIEQVSPYATTQSPKATLTKNAPAYTQPQANTTQNAPAYSQPQAHAQYNFAAFAENQNRANANRVNNSAPAKKPLFDKEKYKSIETWIGARLLNIAASLLVFIGLILFGTLDIVDESVKAVGMHVLSIAVIALGTMLTRKNKTIFSLGITGCGLGALFISILVTHIYFHAITDIVAFALLLVWIVSALYISKILDSLMISITAHMGMAISVCFAFAGGLSDGRIILPVIYQIVSISVLIIGNIFCCKKTYRFGLLLSMGLIALPAAEIVETLRFSSNNLGGLSVGSIILLFSIQALGLSFISYLLSVSTSKLYDSKETGINSNIPIAIHIVNKILWGLGINFCVHDTAFFILTQLINPMGVAHSEPLMILCIFPALHLAVTLFMSEKLNFNEKLGNISIWFNSLYISLLLIVQAEARMTILVDTPLLFVFAAVLILVIKYTKNKKLNLLVTLVLGLDVLCMMFGGYEELIDSHLSFLAFIHIGIVCLLMFIHWYNQKEETKTKHYLLFKTIEYLWLNIGIISIICEMHFNLYYNFDLDLTLIILSAISIIAYVCKYGGQEKNYLNLIIKVTSLIIITISLIRISDDVSTTVSAPILPFVIRTFLILACAGIYFFVAREFIKSKSTIAHLSTGIMFALLIDAICLGFDEYIAIANFYTNSLSYRPYLFILTLALLAIIKITKNDKLILCTLGTLGLDALITITVNFYDLINDSLSVLCFVYMLYGCAMLYVLWSLQSDEVKPKNLLMFKTIAYYFVMISFVSIIVQNKDIPYSIDVSLIFIILLAINIVALVLKYSGEGKNYLLKNIRIVSVTLLFFSLFELGNYISPSNDNLVLCYIIRIVLMLFVVAIYILLAADWIKSDSIFKQILTGFTFTAFVVAFCNGFTSALSIAYVFSMICMVTALICVILGFTIQSKGLRLYGLTVIIVCVLKLVTIDISSANSTARVLALIVGGIICFVISGIYNHVEQKFNAKNPVSFETSNENVEKVEINNSIENQ